MKKNDFILIIVVTIICILLLSVFCLTTNKGKTVSISCDGILIGNYELNEDNRINIPCSEGGYNVISIIDGTVNVSDADCPDLICVNHVPISGTGETIVCLPHKLTIKIID